MRFAHMPKRASGAGHGRRPTDEAIAAGTANLARGREQMAKKRAEARAKNIPKVGERWAMLLDGRLTVADLDDDEIKMMRLRGKDGQFGGRRKALPSHLAQQFRNEAIKRSIDRFRTAAPEAVQGLIEIAQNPETKDADRIKAYAMILDRALGRTPQEVRISGETDWDNLLREVSVARDLIDDSEQPQP